VAGIHLPLHFAACRVHCDGTIQACDLMQTLAVTRNAAVQLEEKARYLASVMSNLLSICNPATWCAIDKPDWSFTLLQSRQQDQINVDSMNNCRLFAICNMKNLAFGASVEHEIEPRFSRRGIVLFLWKCAQMSVLLEELPALLCINLSRRIRTVLERSTLTASNASSRPRPRSHLVLTLLRASTLSISMMTTRLKWLPQSLFNPTTSIYMQYGPQVSAARSEL
jgi:hypothetical protein